MKDQKHHSHRTSVGSYAAGLMALLLVAGVLWQAQKMYPGHSEIKGVPSSLPAKKRVIPGRVAPVLPSMEKRVAGWIVDEQGQPVSGVSVYLKNGKKDGAKAQGVALSRLALSQRDGSFSFSEKPKVGEELMLRGDSIFDSSVRYVENEKGLRILVSRKVKIRGQVLLEGKAFSGAEVFLSDGSGRLKSLKSDAQGKVVFTEQMAGNYEIWARTLNASSVLVRISSRAEDNETVLEMLAATMGSGRVLSRAGKGISALIRLFPKNTEHAIVEVQSDASGDFEIPGLLPGQWEVQVEAPGFAMSVEHVLSISSSGAPLPLAIVLRRSAVISGRVLTTKGQPISNARLVLAQQGEVQATPRETQVTPLLPLRWVHPLAKKRHMPLRDSRRFGAARSGNRPAECGRGHCGVDIGSERGLIVHAAADAKVLRVIRKSIGKAGRYVVLEHQGGLTSFYMHLDEIDPGLISGQNIYAGRAIGTVGRTGVIRSGAHLHFAITMEKNSRTWFVDPQPMLEHAVVLQKSLPWQEKAVMLAGDSLTLRAQRQEIPGVESTVSTVGKGLIFSDQQGQFSVRGIAAGTYVFHAFHEDHAPGKSAIFNVEQGQEVKELTIELGLGIVIEGKVQGRGGPIADAKVYVESGAGEDAHRIAQTFTNAEGWYRLGPLSGSVTLKVEAPGYGQKTRLFRLQEGQNQRLTKRVDFEMSRQDLELKGKVQDPSGFPLRGASLRILSGPSGRGQVAKSNEYGQFVFPQVAEGRYRVECRASGYPIQTQSIETGRFVELRLKEGGSVEILVRDGHSRAPLSGVSIHAVLGEKNTKEVRSDGQGKAILGPLKLGMWRLTIKAKGYVVVKKKIRIEVGETPGAIGMKSQVELFRGARLSGIIRNSAGDRVAGAKVWAGTVTAKSDQNGRFHLEDAPTGTVELEAQKGEEYGRIVLELSPGDELVTLELNFR